MCSKQNMPNRVVTFDEIKLFLTFEGFYTVFQSQNIKKSVEEGQQ